MCRFSEKIEKRRYYSNVVLRDGTKVPYPEVEEKFKALLKQFIQDPTDFIDRKYLFEILFICVIIKMRVVFLSGKGERKYFFKNTTSNFEWLSREENCFAEGSK